MNPQYFPILKVKPGELKALEKLSARSIAKILPMFDLHRQKDGITAMDHLDKLAYLISSAWTGGQVFVDIPRWRPNAQVENGEHVLAYACSQLSMLGVLASAVASYDRWDDPEYQRALVGLSDEGQNSFCIRLEGDALEDIGDPDYFMDKLDEIIDRLDIDPADCFVVVDLGDIFHSAVVDLMPIVTDALTLLEPKGFGGVVVAGCSLPTTVNQAVKKINSAGFVERREAVLWKSICAERRNTDIIFGDYGIRNPSGEEDVIAPNMNGKIRYTLANRYLVVRGHSIQVPPKGAQTHALAQYVINSGHYMGASFSWGDQRIQDCANLVFKGNAGDWIAIDTNHHLEAVLAEIFEFQRHVATLSA